MLDNETEILAMKVSTIDCSYWFIEYKILLNFNVWFFCLCRIYWRSFIPGALDTPQKWTDAIVLCDQNSAQHRYDFLTI